MRKKILLCFTAMLACILTIHLTSCKGSPTKQTEPLDSINVTAVVEPTFNSVNEFEKYVQQLRDKHFNDSILSKMSIFTMDNVASVVQRKKPTFTINDIVDEYLNNIDVYENLPVPTSNTNTQVTVNSSKQDTTLKDTINAEY